jgi:hypothetical protein
MSAAKPYALWWSMTASCSGLTGELAQVRWYVVPSSSSLVVNGREYDGYWFPRENSIVLTLASVSAGMLVRHEMLHALTGSGHSRAYFVEKCGGVVSCDEQCLQDAGAQPEPTSGSDIPATELILTATLRPNAPSLASDSGWIALAVSVTNPLATGAFANLVRIASNPAYSSTFGFSVCTIPCTQPFQTEYEVIEGSRMGFMAGATRRQVFDIQLEPGSYRVTGTYNGRAAASVDVSIAQ